MQLVTMENHLEIVHSELSIGPSLDFKLLDGVIEAIKETAKNWDVVLFLLVTFIVLFGSIIVLICSMKKIFRFQSKMEFKAREEIRKRKMLKHRHLIQTQKSIELEAHEVDTEIEQHIISEDHSPNVDDKIFNELPEPPPPGINEEISEIVIDYSSIDVPDSFDMWPAPPEPIASSDHTNI